MKWYKRAVRFLACIALLSASTPLLAQQVVDKTQPYEMIKIVAEKTFDRLKSEKEQIQADPNLLKTVVKEELMPYVNYQYAALKLLGPHLKGADRSDVKEFITAFEKYLVTTYAQALTLYTDQSVEFEPKPSIPDDRRIVTIKLDIIDAPRPNIKIEFKLRKDKKSSEWEAFDMVAEGISMLSSKQSEWNGVIRKDGIPAVSKELARLAALPISFDSKQDSQQ
ncbi:toluene tolerance protein [Vibrio albus]|uniref:Toluene tolerance protein n=2 Tax=Vibrio albus TaxID=2200953 RepID=A0A2U3BAF3_9VIBR|nr:toluene tolerance protein [Vibrio albus]